MLLALVIYLAVTAALVRQPVPRAQPARMCSTGAEIRDLQSFLLQVRAAKSALLRGLAAEEGRVTEDMLAVVEGLSSVNPTAPNPAEGVDLWSGASMLLPLLASRTAHPARSHVVLPAGRFAVRTSLFGAELPDSECSVLVEAEARSTPSGLCGFVAKLAATLTVDGVVAALQADGAKSREDHFNGGCAHHPAAARASGTVCGLGPNAHAMPACHGRMPLRRWQGCSAQRVRTR